MAIGDIKGDDAIVMVMTAGATITKGQVVHIEADGYWDPVVDTDIGKFGVAVEAITSGETGKILVRGKVEVTATAATIAEGELVMAGTTGLVAKADATGAGLGEVLGTAMTSFGSSGVGTIYVGLVA